MGAEVIYKYDVTIRLGLFHHGRNPIQRFKYHWVVMTLMIEPNKAYFHGTTSDILARNRQGETINCPGMRLYNHGNRNLAIEVALSYIKRRNTDEIPVVLIISREALYQRESDKPAHKHGRGRLVNHLDESEFLVYPMPVPDDYHAKNLNPETRKRQEEKAHADALDGIDALLAQSSFNQP